MSAALALKPGSFYLEGRFLGFSPSESSPFKFMTVATADGERTIKLSKDLRLMLFRALSPGDWVRVIGKQKVDKHDGTVSYKAKEVVKGLAPTGIASPSAMATAIAVTSVEAPTRPVAQRSKAKVLVCQKSACRKRGADAVCRSLAESFEALGIGDRVKIQGTGCMDRCKAGPNLVVMPDKGRYSRVTPGMIPDLVEQHFAQLAPHAIADADDRARSPMS